MRLTLAMLLAVLPLTAGAETPDWWKEGATYSGRGVQSDGPQWNLVLTITSPLTARISYPSIPCAGTLNILASNAGSLMAEELITDNPANCTSGGVFRLQDEAGGVIRFTWADNIGGTTATGALTAPGSKPALTAKPAKTP